MSAFVDRIKETEKIVTDIGISSNTSNRIIFIAGKTGIGKSCLVNKILLNDVSGFRAIQLDICKNVAQTISAGSYFKYLVSSIDKLGRDHFYKDIPSKFKYSVSLSNLIKVIISGLLSQKFSQGYYYNKLAERENIIGNRNYIISILKKHSYIIHIPNTQFMDMESIELLIDISKKITHTVFIFEYTIDESNDESQLFSLMEHCKKMKGILSYNIIDKLPFDEVRRIIDSRISSDYLYRIYSCCEGNIYQLILCKEDMPLNENPIHASLRELSQNERFLMHILYMHDGFWPSNQLCSILVNCKISPISTIMDFEKSVHTLMELKFVKLNNKQELHIAHDSIIAEIEKDKMDAVHFIAYNVTKSYYIDILHDNECALEVQLLFQNMISFSDNEIMQYLPILRKIIKHWKYPHTVLARLANYREVLTSSVNNYDLFEKLSIFLTNLSVDYGSYTEAQKNLKLIYNHRNAYHRALKAKTLTLMENSDEAKTEYEFLLNSAETDRERLVIELCKLSRDMALNSGELSQKKAKELFENPAYKSFPEYAFVLRNYAELVDDYNLSLNLYKESYHIFILNNRKDLAAQVLVSKCMFLAYKGELKGAYKTLDKAVKLDEIGEIYELNNYAVLDILSGKTSVKTTALLNDTLLLQNDPYEKIITECNLLTAYCILKDKIHAEQTYLQILNEDGNIYQYQEFLHILYTDIYYYANSFEDEELAKRYRKLLLDLYKNVPPKSMVAKLIKAQILDDESINLYYARFPFRVDFLGYWDIDISPDLESF